MQLKWSWALMGETGKADELGAPAQLLLLTTRQGDDADDDDDAEGVGTSAACHDYETTLCGDSRDGQKGGVWLVVLVLCG